MGRSRCLVARAARSTSIGASKTAWRPRFQYPRYLPAGRSKPRMTQGSCLFCPPLSAMDLESGCTDIDAATLRDGMGTSDEAWGSPPSTAKDHSIGRSDCFPIANSCRPSFVHASARPYIPAREYSRPSLCRQTRGLARLKVSDRHADTEAETCHPAYYVGKIVRDCRLLPEFPREK